jgi:hypothetical protein
MNNAVDAAARKVLEKVNGIKINYVKDKNDGGLIGSTALNTTQADRNASGGSGKIVYSELDSTEYEYGVASTPSFSSGNASTGGKSAGGMINPTDLGQYFNGSKSK